MEYDPDVRRKALAHIETYGLAPTHRRIVSIVGSERNVLDVGCATGYLSEAMAANNCIVTGLEKDAEAAGNARAFCREVHIGDAGDPAVLQTAGSNYDVIVCADVLEHLVDPWVVLRTMKTMLAPGGEIIVSVPNIAYWRMRCHLMAGRFTYTDTGLLDRTHLRFFTIKSFASMAKESGLRVVEMIVNDAGLPGFPRTLDWDRLPGWARKITLLLPNLCVFHAIWRLAPAEID